MDEGRREGERKKDRERERERGRERKRESITGLRGADHTLFIACTATMPKYIAHAAYREEIQNMAVSARTC